MTIAHAQSTQNIISELATVYTGSADGGLLGGMSTAGMIWGLLFSSLGFIVFMYGKKNSFIRPTLIGVALMIYPYFVQGTHMIVLVGAGLTALLYFWRD